MKFCIEIMYLKWDFMLPAWAKHMFTLSINEWKHKAVNIVSIRFYTIFT